MGAVVQLWLAIVLLAVAACGDDGAAVDAASTDDAASQVVVVTGMFEGAAFTMNNGIATALGTTVLDISAADSFAVVLADQPLSCDTDIAARPSPGLYLVLYAPSLTEGVVTDATFTLLNQTSGPRMSKTGQGGTTNFSTITASAVQGTTNHMIDGEATSAQGAFQVPICP